MTSKRIFKEYNVKRDCWDSYNVQLITDPRYEPLERYHWNTTDEPNWFAEERERQGINWDYYNSEDLTYDFNGIGFRDGPVEREHWAAFGCSLTLGTGLYLSEIWTRQLGRMTKTHIQNFGISGACNEYSVHNIIAWLEWVTARPTQDHRIRNSQSPCQGVIWQVTHRRRLQAMARERVPARLKMVSPENVDDGNGEIAILNAEYDLDSLNLAFQVKVVQNICDILGIPLIILDLFNQFDEYTGRSNVVKVIHDRHKDGMARDGVHPSRIYNTNIAKALAPFIRSR